MRAIGLWTLNGLFAGTLFSFAGQRTKTTGHGLTGTWNRVRDVEMSGLYIRSRVEESKLGCVFLSVFSLEEFLSFFVCFILVKPNSHPIERNPSRAQNHFDVPNRSFHSGLAIFCV